MATLQQSPLPTNALFLGSVVCPLKDPIPERQHRRSKGRDRIPQLDLANSFYVPSGRWPSRGWVLVRRGDYNQIANKFTTGLSLNFTDVQTGTSTTFLNLAIVQARCVSRGIASDPDAVYLVELTDARGLLQSPWFEFGTISQYNVLAPAYPGQYYLNSENSGSPWAWSDLVQDLWTQMGAFLGTFPSLPFTPTGTPQGFSFPGVCCWDALCRILDLQGMTISVDPTLASPYGIVTIGDPSPLTELQAKYAGVLEDDLEYIDAGAGRVPGQVTVYFHRKNEIYGSEETVRQDALQWWTTPLYSVTINAPAQYAAAPGKGFLWADFVVRYDTDGNPLAADVATAGAVASQLVTSYYNRIARSTSGYLRQVYTGALPFTANSLVDGVRWYATAGGGFRTEIVRGDQPPWPEVMIEDGRAS